MGKSYTAEIEKAGKALAKAIVTQQPRDARAAVKTTADAFLGVALADIVAEILPCRFSGRNLSGLPRSQPNCMASPHAYSGAHLTRMRHPDRRNKTGD